MPDMPLVDMAGEPFKLSALKGQTVIVNIIAMNSPHSLSFSSGRTYYTFRQVMPSSKLLSAVETLFFLNIPVDGERLTIVHLLADDAGAPITQAAMTRWYKAMRMEQRGKGHVLVRWSGELLKSPPAPSMRIVDPEGRVTFRTDTTEKPIHWTQELIELEKVVLTRAERYPPKQYPPNPDPGLALFHGRQWAALDAHLDALRKRPRDPQRLRSPYQLAVGKLGTVSTKELPTIEAWIEARPKSVHARWLLGAVLISYAWQARGGGYANTVSDKGWKLFHERVRQARAALESALELDPKHGPSWSSLIVVAMAESNKAKLREAFDKAMAADPDDFHACSRYLNAIYPKWGGSWGQVADFIAEVETARERPVFADLLTATAMDERYGRRISRATLTELQTKMRSLLYRLREVYLKSRMARLIVYDLSSVLQINTLYVDSMRKAAYAGDRKIAKMLGTLSIINRSRGFDPMAGYLAFRRLFESNSLDGAVGIGVAYLKGESVARDVDCARAWLEYAAERNDTNAMIWLGDLYQGEYNTIPELKRAYANLRRARELNHPDARRKLHDFLQKHPEFGE